MKSMKRTTVALAAACSLVLAACGTDGDDVADDVTEDVAEVADEEATDEEAAAQESDDSESDDSETGGEETGDAAGDSPAQSEGDDAAADVPTIVVTTNILGDVVSEMVGDAAEVVTIMPVGSDPHTFQASAQEADAMVQADALVTNGADFEEGLIDLIANAESEGVPTFAAMSVIDTIDYAEGDAHDHDHEGDDHDHDHEGDDHDHDHEGDDHDHDHEGDDHDHDHEGDDHDHDHEGDDHDHDHEGDTHAHHHHDGVDPHFFTDPARMAVAVEGILGFLQAELDVDPEALTASADAYLAELDQLDADVAALVEAIPEERRVLVTNHNVFGYYADRYGFEVIGTVIPGLSTTANASAGEIAELAELIEAEGVPAIFADNTASPELVETLAAEVGDIEVVELYTGSLGEPGSDGDTYVAMVRTNAERMSAALS